MITRNILPQLGAKSSFYLGRALFKIGKRIKTKRTYLQAGEVFCYSRDIRLDPTFAKSNSQLYVYQGEALFALGSLQNEHHIDGSPKKRCCSQCLAVGADVEDLVGRT